MKCQIRKLVDEIILLIGYMKGGICVFPGVRNNPKAHDIIFGIFSKLNIKVQNYLVRIKYWESQMTDEERRLYGLD